MTTLTDDAPATPAGAAPRKTVKPPRRPCEFCNTGHHGLCPETIQNASAGGDRTWTCLCFEHEHTLGRQPAVRSEIVRMSPATVASLDEIRAAKIAARAAAAAPAAPRRVEAPASADGSLHTHCEKCGWDFGKPVPQAVCGSPRMCARRVEVGDPTFGRRKSA